VTCVLVIWFVNATTRLERKKQPAFIQGGVDFGLLHLLFERFFGLASRALILFLTLFFY
jgi:hypothetical protein